MGGDKFDKFQLVSNYRPTGDQPQAIQQLVEGLNTGMKEQTLLGVTGSGKTFTMANVIAQVNRPTLVLAHNHPSGNAAASRNDITATRQVEMALESIEATLNDHIIFAGEDTLSFAQCGWLGQIKEEVRDYRREELQAAREQEAAILWGDSLL